MMNSLYYKSPIFVQNILITLYGYYWKNRRFGKGFQKELTYWKERESYSHDEWINYQTKELQKLLIHAFDTVPYYHKLYIKEGFKREDFVNFSLKDLKSLPYLEKDDFRKFGKTELLSRSRKRGQFYASSGSTGKPISVFMSKEFQRKWNAAYESRVRNWAGVDYKMSRGMIGGRKILKDSSAKPPYHRYNHAERQTYFSAYHISEENVLAYAKAFNEHKIDYMVGYAMSNYFLADLLVKKGITVPKLKAILTSSEKLTKEMRDTFQKAYGCQTFDAYSGVEACGLISQDIYGDFLFSPDSGIMEVVNENGVDVKNGEIGEIVATGLLNYDQPLIRYKIGDKVEISKDQTTKSGKQMLKIDQIWGRVEDILQSSDGKKIVRFHSIFLDINGLIAGQIVQESLLKIRLNLVVDNAYEKSSELVFRERVQNLLGDSVQVNICYLESIPKNNNGKFQSVISNLR
ncbi:hypothetical protein RQM59_05985 [Flavobacteriaceae bacterium S356]|uniref:Phenylacetate-CoA ligase n=1 Tax=Asprobacillus argus TaxID=3076534 RepID=A0ABU3LDY3_9FLAO|nr:hypothetical protein [Flavobacteriaceae bacterium S356]